MHPTQGVEKFHYGIDIGAGYGETIMAAASGTVIFVTEPYEGCNKGGSGYGNYCVIDHGNGYTTLYGHARDLYVYEGQYVNAGDSIGEVGSTGDSSGAHLHFEVRLWGETKDPEDYLP
jgi:murein DD-endopeptidase MepM/ murein hydrolase activator NlpD